MVKTDGLAAGKGVLVAASLAEAEADVAAKLSGRAFGAAGRRGRDRGGADRARSARCIVLCDGRRVVPLAPAQDFKRVGRRRPRPQHRRHGRLLARCPDVDDGLVDRLMDEAVEPLVAALRARGIDYRGVLYAGLMLTADGPKVLEYNVRFGDPEAQVVLPRLADDPVELLLAVAEGALGEAPALSSATPPCAWCWPPTATPARCRAGDAIDGLGRDGQLADPVEGVTVFHAGTRRDRPDGPFLTAGGRVLGVSALGADPGRGPATGPTRPPAGSAGRERSTAGTSPSGRRPSSAGVAS